MMAPKLFKCQMASNFIDGYNHSLHDELILSIKSDLTDDRSIC